MADATLSALFEDSVQVSTKDLSYDLHPGEVDQNDEPSRILLGKIYCYSRLGRKAIHGSLRNAWNSLTGWSWKEREDGILQFTFQTRMDAENVLLRRPWLVCGHLLVLMPWPSWLSISEVDFDQTPIWVRLKSIPPFYWNKTNLKELAGKVSTNYELPRHIENYFERGSTGIKDLWIQYQYERLPKLCLKCGALSHEQKYCFKNPTVIRDEKGAFFPMFGTWMDEEAKEKSPFNLPLPKWFNDWIAHQQALKDPMIRNQLALKRRLNVAETSEWRELRRQFPGKRRQVEVTVEERPATDEIVLNRFPAVELPGIGEVTPFDNTAEGVVEKVIPIRPLKLITTTGDASTDPGNNTEPATTSGGTKACSQSDEVDRANGDNGNLPANGKKGPDRSSASDSHSSSRVVCKVAVSERENFTLSNKFQVGLSYNTLLGPQAQPLDWPSRECWANAFGPLTGSITVDKFQREPTILNPILSIDDFNCYDSDHGPRKRKAVDGFYMIPEEAIDTTFSPGSNDDKPIKRKRGRPKKYEQTSPSSALIASKRGRPSKSKEPTGVISQSLKKKGAKSSSRGKEKHYRNLWNAKCIDLAIDLDNHFVVIEKKVVDKPKCRIEELGDNGFSFWGYGDLPGKVSNTPMKLLAWNFRGLGNAAAVRQLTAVVRRSNPDILILSETRLVLEKFQQLMNKMHFTEILYVSPIGLSGGFGVCWKQRVLCKIMEADKNVLIGTIESDPPGISWNFMGIYGPPSMTGRELFWNRIGDLLANGSSPTVLLGDLNGTLADHECLYYTNQNNAARYSFDLRRMVARTGLIDLGCLGGKFTWFQKTSNSIGSNAIRRARLDRALASTDWRILFPNAIVELLTVSTSDHKPILLNTDGGVRRTKAQFKYELMWGRDPRCFWVVRNAWRERLHHNPMVNLYRKLKRTRDHLQRWNKTHFKKIHQQVTEAKNDLAKIESNDQRHSSRDSIPFSPEIPSYLCQMKTF
ncbi:hypothetical protein F8388_020087 [Cannabis sativa]|uniref:DUF4283 domain-containing protein n=1 Tax=Cannabis sativa TaxID=3483 RepID=A0A7J6F7U2_CANSA|nr:hypothetical protein F8388_020087 [Cannabis sativa]KAF4402261.1 hypothetical protein G4B88_017773 [Cannabis sativa]